ncbi:18851_t:CDS:2, partial [Gigaspora rosea]
MDDIKSRFEDSDVPTTFSILPPQDGVIIETFRGGSCTVVFLRG